MSSKLVVDLIGVSTEIIILHMFFFSIFPEKKKFTFPLAITSTLTFIFTLLLSYLPMNLVERILLIWLTVIIFSLPFPCKLTRKILLSFIPVSINSCMEILAGAIQITLYDSVQIVVTNDIAQYTQGVMLSKLLSLFFILFLAKSSCTYMSTISKNILACFVFILCTSILLVHQIFPLLLLSNDTYLHTNFLFLCSSIVVINVVFFYAIYDINKKEQANLEYIHLANTQKAQELLTRELTQKQEETNMLIHDTHNKLITLSTYAKQKNYEKILESIDSLDKELLANQFQLTNCPELDALIGSKINLSKQKNINFISLVSDFKLPIDIFLFNTIVGNLLDNAIEGCKKDPLTGKKEITFTIKSQNNFIVLLIENTIDKKVYINKDFLIPTTKNDKKLHGIGLKSVKHIISKANGDFYINSSDNKFTASVLLPISEEIENIAN